MARKKLYSIVLPVALLLGAVALAGCDKAKNKRPTYAGVPFKITTKPVDKKVSRADFTVKVDEAALSLDGARQAAYHSGVTYCLNDGGYGTSRIIWDVDPQDPESQLRLVDGAAVFQGKCDP